MKISSRHTIGIIGGEGRTGGQFAKILKKKGFDVRVTGSKTKQRNASILRDCDIVIFSLPLKSAATMMRGLSKKAKRKDQLLLDLSSLKVNQVKAMLGGAGEVIGMHPLFGPTTGHAGQTIVLCPVRCKNETIKSLLQLFAKLGINTKVMTAAEHDKLMGVLQVLPHLKSLLVADVLQKIGGNVIDTIDRTATPAYRIELNLVGRFLDDAADLYGPIILDNPETVRILGLLQQSLGEIMQMAGSKNLRAFSRKYASLKKFFGHQTDDGREKTEICIRTMSEMKNR
jgi:prephenate dehydrogenase